VNLRLIGRKLTQFATSSIAILRAAPALENFGEFMLAYGSSNCADPATFPYDPAIVDAAASESGQTVSRALYII
jgi:hypothetical protein